MKRKFICIMCLVMSLILQSVLVSAEEKEWYELKEDNHLEENFRNLDDSTTISPNTLYIAGATISLKKMSTTKISMRSEVFCSETMKKIETTFKLQKKSGNSWVTVGTGTVSESDSTALYKSMSAYNVASGTYRCIASSKATSYSGYSETVSVTSGNVTM